MIAVSEAYKSAMALPFRSRGHARVDLGVAQSNVDGTATGEYYAGYESGIPVGAAYAPKTARYAGLDLFCVDGSMILPAKGANRQPVFQTEGENAVGAISEELMGFGSDALTLTFGAAASWNGLSMIFDEVFPRKITVYQNYNAGSYYKKTEYALNNTVFKINTEFKNVSNLRFEFDNPSRSNIRTRIQGIIFGFFARYEDDSILSIDWSSSADPVSAEFPTMDASVELYDGDNLYNPDDEDNVLYTLDITGKASIFFGVTLEDDSVEWVHMMDGEIDSWQYSRNNLKMKLTDFFRSCESNDSMTIKDYEGRTQPDATLSGNELRANVPVFDSLPMNAVVAHALNSAGLLDYGEAGATDTDAGYAVLENEDSQFAILDQPVKGILQSAANKAQAMSYIARDGHLVMKRISTDEPVYTLSNGDIFETGDAESPQKVKSVTVRKNGYDANDTSNYDRHFFVPFKGNTLEESPVFSVTQDSAFTVVLIKIYTFYGSLTEGATLDQLPEGAEPFDISEHEISTITMNIGVKDIDIAIEWGTQGGYPSNFYFIFEYQLKSPSKAGTDTVFYVNDRGSAESWDNPLVNTDADVQTVGRWLTVNYQNYREFEFDYRGDPSLETGDVIYQYSPFGGNKQRKALITETSISYDGSFTGHLKTKAVD